MAYKKKVDDSPPVIPIGISTELEERVLQLEKAVTSILGKLDKLETPIIKTPEVIPPEVIGPSKMMEATQPASSKADYVAPEWRRYVDEKLGTDFGLTANYPASGGFEITISVPKIKSNAAKDHWMMHNCDLRTKAISPALGFEGVKQYVDLVAKNLGNNLRNKE